MVVGGALNGALKVAALVDLAGRPAAHVRGAKVAWAVAITLISSLGVVPIVYFIADGGGWAHVAQSAHVLVPTSVLDR